MESYNTHNTKPHKPNSTGGGGGRHEASASPTDLFSSAQVLAGAAMSTFRHESTKVDKSEAAAAADNLLHAVSQYGHLEEKSYGKYIDKAEGYLHKYSAPSSQPPSHGSGPAKKYQQEEYEEEEEYNTGHKPSYASGKVKKQEEQYEYEQYNSAGHKPSYASGKVKKQQQEEEYDDDEEEYASHETSARPNSYASGKTKKHQEEEEEESEGGIGDYMKLAQGFMKSQGGGGGGGGHSSGGGESEGAGIGDYMKLAQGFLGKR